MKCVIVKFGRTILYQTLFCVLCRLPILRFFHVACILVSFLFFSFTLLFPSLSLNLCLSLFGLLQFSILILDRGLKLKNNTGVKTELDYGDLCIKYLEKSYPDRKFSPSLLKVGWAFSPISMHRKCIAISRQWQLKTGTGTKLVLTYANVPRAVGGY